MLAVEDLVDLGEKLRAANFKLAPHQILSAQQVLATLEARHQLPKQRHQLAQWLGPIFCTSPAEQQRFPETFHEWLREHFGEAPPKTAPQVTRVVRPPIVPPRLRLVWKPVLALAGLLLAATTAWGAWQHWQPRVVIGKVVVAGENGAPLGNVKVKLGERQSAHTDERGNFRFRTRAADLPETLQLSLDGFTSQPVPVAPKFADLRQRLYLGRTPKRIDVGLIALTRIGPAPQGVKIEMPPDAPAAPMPIGAPRTIDLTSALPSPTLWERLAWDSIAVTLLPIVAFVLWQLWRMARRPVLQRQASSAPPLLRAMHLPPGVAPLAPGLPMRRLAQELRRRRVVNSAELQVDLTIAATLRNAGLFTPMLGSRIEPEYLALIDTACLSDHQARLCNEFVGELIRSDVQIDRYTFDRTPAMCQRRGMQAAATTFSIDAMQTRMPDHRVLLFCDGSGLFDSFTGAPVPCVATLLQWESVFLLTARPLEQWGETEWALENLGFKVLPLTRDGVLWLMSMLSGAPAAQPARTSAKVDRPVPRYDRARRRWLERNPPDAAEVTRLCDSLRSDLGERGFAWLAGCAVYPEIHWGITLRVGAALVPDREQRESLLPGIARLVWMRDAWMPDWLRQSLLDRLSAKDEHSIRAVMHAMLGTLSGEPDADVPLHIATSTPVPGHGWRALVARLRAALATWRRRRRSESVIRSAHADSPLRDYVFLRFISGQSVGKLSLAAPGALLKLLFRGGSPFLGFRPALVLAAALLTSGAIAVAIGPLRMGQVITLTTDIHSVSQGDAFSTRLVKLTQGVRLDQEEGIVIARRDGTVGRVIAGLGLIGFSPDQRYVLAAEGDASRKSWSLQDSRTREVVFRGEAEDCAAKLRCPLFSADGRWFAFPTSGNKVGLLDLSAGIRRVPDDFFAGGPILAFAFSNDSSMLAASVQAQGFNREHTIVVWKIDAGLEVRAVIVPEQAPETLHFSADGREVLGTVGQSVVVWDLDSHQRVRSMPLRDEKVAGTALAREGRMMAIARYTVIGGAPGKVTLMDVSNGATLDELSDADMPAVLDVDFSPDGTALAAAAFDGKVRLWTIPENYPAPKKARSFALVVANQWLTRAQSPDLAPAKEIADALRARYGFGVTVLENVRGAQIRDALLQYEKLLQPDDQLLIYLFGRASTDKNGAYSYQAYGASRDNLSGDTLVSSVRRMSAGQVLILADTPNASALGSIWRNVRDTTPAPPGSRGLIAASPRRPPDPIRFSMFGEALEQALRDGSAPRTTRGLLAAMTQHMMAVRASIYLQAPAYLPISGNGNTGEFQFPAPKEGLSVSVQVMDFGDIELQMRGKERIAEITNTSDRPVRLRAAWNTKDGSQPKEFPGKDSCTGRTIGPKESCQLLVEFVPDTIGELEYRVRYMDGSAVRAEIVVRGNSPSPYEQNSEDMKQQALPPAAQ